MIPKSPIAAEMGDFRSIYCVNLIYKLLTKILADRLSQVLGELLSPNQTAFTKGRTISDNTMLAEEMIFDLGRKRIPKICCIGIDLIKAFDTVRWEA